MTDDSDPQDWDNLEMILETDQLKRMAVKDYNELLEELEALVSEWREKAEAKDSDVVGNVQYQMLHERANDLSKVIQEYRGASND